MSGSWPAGVHRTEAVVSLCQSLGSKYYLGFSFQCHLSLRFFALHTYNCSCYDVMLLQHLYTRNCILIRSPVSFLLLLYRPR